MNVRWTIPPMQPDWRICDGERRRWVKDQIGFDSGLDWSDSLFANGPHDGTSVSSSISVNSCGRGLGEVSVFGEVPKSHSCDRLLLGVAAPALSGEAEKPFSLPHLGVAWSVPKKNSLPLSAGVLNASGRGVIKYPF